jgi:hypothetical protein
LGLDPIEQEVVVLYKGEKTKKPEEFWKVRFLYAITTLPTSF